jgi:hypothetical protein
MNDPINRQAMIAVERVVGPVRASMARKRRMRYRASVTSTSHRLKRPNPCSARVGLIDRRAQIARSVLRCIGPGRALKRRN